jgi:hypothetical protein
MIRPASLFCAILTLTACAPKAPHSPPAPAQTTVTAHDLNSEIIQDYNPNTGVVLLRDRNTRKIIGGFMLGSTGNIVRNLTPSELEELRKRGR